jgi:hypothetical protein
VAGFKSLKLASGCQPLDGILSAPNIEISYSIKIAYSTVCSPGLLGMVSSLTVMLNGVISLALGVPLTAAPSALTIALSELDELFSELLLELPAELLLPELLLPELLLPSELLLEP